MIGATYVFVGIRKVLALRNANDEQSQKDVPQVKGELLSEMNAHVGRPSTIIHLVVASIESERLFLIDVGAADADGNREDGDVHHHHVADLDCRVERRNAHGRKTRGSGRSGLEQPDYDPVANGNAHDFRILEVQRDK